MATDALSDIGFRQRLHNAAVRALEQLGGKKQKAAENGTAAELAFLIDSLRKMGCE